MAFRFALHKGRAESMEEWLGVARRAETAGYRALYVSDHLGALDPLLALQAAAGATERIRLGTNVLNNDFWHPVMLARAAATVDLLSGGRFELGLGAGWNHPEYEAAGIGFDRAGKRIERMDEAAGLLRRLFAGENVTHIGEHYRLADLTLEPLPTQGAGLPIMIGGNGDRLLRSAAHHTDLVGLTGFGAFSGGMRMSHFSREGMAERVAFTREAAGERADDLEFVLLVQRAEITDDPEAMAAGMAERYAEHAAEAPDAAAILGSPFVLIGSEDEIESKLQSVSAETGVRSYVVFADGEGGIDGLVGWLGST